YNNDGWLDLYIGKYWGPNVLYKNNGNGTFTNVAAQAGAADKRDTDGVIWGDYDTDGDLDLYVVNREQDNTLYRNDGNGTFTEVACGVGVNDIDIGRNAVWGDYDNDGDLDLYAVNTGAKALYRNDNGAFTDVAEETGVRQTRPGWVSWDAVWGDYDHDGDLDLYVAGGGESSSGERGVLFSNSGGVFRDVTLSLFGSDARFHSVACGWGDYDNDGDLDLYVVNGGGGMFEADVLYQNDLNDGNYVKVRPRRANAAGEALADGIGAKVRLFDASGNLLGYQEVQSGASALETVFGVPGGGTYRVEVTFLSGKIGTKTATAGETVEVIEGQ
ncbi:MAG: VCBS repeat-containing protein, partial [Candidatus Latescibacteria bacterium]|nr:VCBS repeat-containing protein [Candidatus Latescibacterota bacterium]